MESTKSHRYQGFETEATMVGKSPHYTIATPLPKESKQNPTIGGDQSPPQPLSGSVNT